MRAKLHWRIGKKGCIEMKYFRQFGIILVVTFMAEVLGYLLPLPIPSSIYGLVLMLLALHFRIIKLPQVKEASVFLLEIMPMMFIPAAVGLMVVFPSLRSILFPVVIITVVSTFVVMIVAGRVTQSVILSDRRRADKKIQKDSLNAALLKKEDGGNDERDSD